MYIKALLTSIFRSHYCRGIDLTPRIKAACRLHSAAVKDPGLRASSKNGQGVCVNRSSAELPGETAATKQDMRS